MLTDRVQCCKIKKASHVTQAFSARRPPSQLVPIGETISIFHAKLQIFGGMGALFGTFLALFCRLFMQNFSFLRGWELFLSKKRQFFSSKTSVFGGLVGLFEKKKGHVRFYILPVVHVERARDGS